MGFITKKHLSRRTLIRGAGVTLALPFLESMLPAATPSRQAAANPPTRLGCIYFPHGVTQDKWKPATTGTGFEFTEILQPLEPFRDRINVISDMSHPQAYGAGSATANHQRSSAVFLSGAPAQFGDQAYLGITMDQVAAQKIGQDTILPSLEMSIEAGSPSAGTTSAYSNTISWQGPTSPLPMQNNPQVVFEQLFGEGATEEDRRKRREQSLGLLDYVLGEVATLRNELPAHDRIRMEQYLDDVREIERRVERAGQQVPPDLDIGTAPVGIPRSFDDHLKLMFDLMVLAWQADITRVSTLLMSKELSNTTFPNSGVSDGFHNLSHHGNGREMMDRFAVMNRYHHGLFGYLLEKLRDTPDGDGNLLDHSMVLWGSGLGNSHEHNHTPLPVILAGGASGRLQGGRHIQAEPYGMTMCNLLLAMLDKLDVPAETFGDSTGMLDI
jgi:hypothetical protein